MEGESSEQDENDDGAHNLKVSQLEACEGFLEERFWQSNPLSSRR